MTDSERELEPVDLGEELARAFLDAYPELPPEELRHMARNLTQVIVGVVDIGMKTPAAGDISHMDRANTFVYWCLAGTRLEGLIAGDGEAGPDASALTGELAARSADLLLCEEVLSRYPVMEEAFVRGTVSLMGQTWERNRGKLEH